MWHLGVPPQGRTDKLCPVEDLRCGNGTIRSPHPVELFGDDWYDWLQAHEAKSDSAAL
ncbi:MAG: DUF3079 domain-containing protein [Candidatus Solibacter sp.]